MWEYNHSPSSDELYHHGIKGMKWGVRKEYEPHPRKRKGARSCKKGLTDKQKRAIKIGAAVAATALAVYGGYKLTKSGKLDGIIDKPKPGLWKTKGENFVIKNK